MSPLQIVPLGPGTYQASIRTQTVHLVPPLAVATPGYLVYLGDRVAFYDADGLLVSEHELRPDSTQTG